eukprot:scaffold15022_cov117-Isochrysis_galbana.AAC.8
MVSNHHCAASDLDVARTSRLRLLLIGRHGEVEVEGRGQNALLALRRPSSIELAPSPGAFAPTVLFSVCVFDRPMPQTAPWCTLCSIAASWGGCRGTTYSLPRYRYDIQPQPRQPSSSHQPRLRA